MSGGTLLTNAFHTFGATGNREDLTDFISMISPTDTPFYDSIGTVGANATLHEWQTDKLRAAGDNAAVEGKVFAAVARTPTGRLTNRTQIFTEEFSVTETQQVVNKAGRGNEGAYQLKNAAKALKNDMEWTLFNWTSSASGAAGSSTAPRYMRSMHDWVINVTGNTGYSGLPAYTITGWMTANAVIAESTFNQILQDIWDEGGRPNVVYTGGALRRLVNGWGTSTSRVWDGSKKITNDVNVYESSFGVLQLKLERHSASSIGYILDESLFKKAVLIPTGMVEISKTGLGDNYMLRNEWTIESRNASGCGAFLSA